MAFTDDVFSWLGVTDATFLTFVFVGCAILGIGVFLIWFVLAMVGGVAEGALGGFGFDADLGADADLSFQILTLQGIAAFLMMFGLIGMAILNTSDNQALAVIGGTIAGGASMWAVSKLFSLFISLQSSGTIQTDRAIGQTARVHLSIPESGTGEVQVTVHGTLRTLPATTADGSRIDTERYVKVVDVLSDDVLVVESVHADRDADADEIE